MQKREMLLLILFSLVAGIIYDYFFNGKSLGVSYPIFVLLFLGLFWWSTRKMLSADNYSGWFVLLPVLLLSSAFAFYSNPVLAALNYMLIPLLLIAHLLLITNYSSTWWELGIIGDILSRIFPRTFANFPKPFRAIARELWPAANSSAYGTGKKILIGLLISVPLLLIVVPLLSSADLVFNQYLLNFAKIGELFNFSMVTHAIFILFVSLYVFGLIWSFQAEHPSSQAGEKTAGQPAWDPTILLTVLSVIGIVYLLFSIIQFSYLYGGPSRSLVAGFSYADYARAGFFELVAVTVINLSILLASLRFVKKDNQSAYRLVRIILSLLVVFSLNMLFSAHFKMSLYEKAFGLTYLRIFVHFFMGLLFVLFAIAWGSIWSSRISLVKSYIVVALVFYTALNFINVDRIIARYNVNMYAKTGKVDVDYLQSLSYDALPEVIGLAKDNNQEIARQVKDYLYLLDQRLSPSEERPWPSFNYSRYRAKSALDRYFKVSAP